MNFSVLFPVLASARDGDDGFSYAKVPGVTQNILELIFFTLIMLCGPYL